MAGRSRAVKLKERHQAIKLSFGHNPRIGGQFRSISYTMWPAGNPILLLQPLVVDDDDDEDGDERVETESGSAVMHFIASLISSHAQ